MNRGENVQAIKVAVDLVPVLVDDDVDNAVSALNSSGESETANVSSESQRKLNLNRERLSKTLVTYDIPVMVLISPLLPVSLINKSASVSCIATR